jgi:hypothetical protein
LNDAPAARPALAESLIGSQLGAIEKIERVRDFLQSSLVVTPQRKMRYTSHRATDRDVRIRVTTLD